MTVKVLVDMNLSPERGTALDWLRLGGDALVYRR